MNSLKCSLCNAETIRNNCNCSVFITKKINDIEDLQSCDQYEKFLNIINEKTKINKDILEILIKINGISNIINCSIQYIKGKYKLIIAEDLQLIENYEKSIEYIFATYILNKKEYVRTSNQKLCIYFNNEKNIYLQLFDVENHYYDSDFLLLIEYNINDVIPYDVKLLTKDENIKLKNYIEEKFIDKLCFVKVEKNIEKDYLSFSLNDNLSIHLDKCLKDIHKEIDKMVKKSIIKLKEEINQEKEKNKSFFERALLETQIKNF